MDVWIVWDDDHWVFVDEVDELFNLVQLNLDLLPTVLFGKGVSQEWKALVGMMKVGPVGSQTLKRAAVY